VQLLGVLARVTVGYCLMERLLVLMPWNRSSMPSWREVLEALLTRPGSGGLWHTQDAAVPSACSLRSVAPETRP